MGVFSISLKSSTKIRHKKKQISGNFFCYVRTKKIKPGASFHSIGSFRQNAIDKFFLKKCFSWWRYLYQGPKKALDKGQIVFWVLLALLTKKNSSIIVWKNIVILQITVSRSFCAFCTASSYSCSNWMEEFMIGKNNWAIIINWFQGNIPFRAILGQKMKWTAMAQLQPGQSLPESIFFT